MGCQMEEEKQVFYIPIFAGCEKCRKVLEVLLKVLVHQVKEWGYW